MIFQDNVNFDTYTMRDHLIKCIERMRGGQDRSPNQSDIFVVF